MPRGFQSYRKTDLRRALIAAREAGVQVAKITLPGGAVVEFSPRQQTASEAKAETVANRRGNPARRQAAAA